jgi:hypothetical protein
MGFWTATVWGVGLARQGRVEVADNLRRWARGLPYCEISAVTFDRTPALFNSSGSIRSDLGNRIRQPVVGDGKVP